jgi:hypothetical protein
MTIARSLRQVYEAVNRSVVEAAQARGELAPGVDAMLLFDVLAGSLHKKLLLDREAVDDDYMARMVDLILHGALAPQVREAAAATVPARRRRG